MDNTAIQIAKLVDAANPAAPITTHALATLGNGNMQEGIKRIIRYFAAQSLSNLKKGRLQGFVFGSASTLVFCGGIFLVYRLYKKKHDDSEGTAILSAIQNSMNDNLQGQPPETQNIIIQKSECPTLGAH